MKDYIRQPYYNELWQALQGQINLIQAVVGPRQVGKTTLALQLFERWNGPRIYETADQPNIPSFEWINTHWQKIRELYKKQRGKSLLILDEVQKIPHWSEVVKKLFDEDRRQNSNIRVLLLGSSSLLMHRGLSESLAGRFELQRHNQWSFPECRDCFSLTLKEYIYFGGYPGALIIRKDELRWASYVRDSLIETVLSKDIILLSPIAKPILLRQSFGMAIDYAAQVISYQKMLGTLQDAGNTTTIASYLQLLSNAFLLTPLQRYSGSRIRQRGSIPKMLIFDNGLISAMRGENFKTVIKDKAIWGRLVENVAGAQLYFITKKKGGELFYWRERDNEIDYVLKIGSRLQGIEIKSGRPDKKPAAFESFKKKYKKSESIIISDAKSSKIDFIRNINLYDFFNNPEKIFTSR